MLKLFTILIYGFFVIQCIQWRFSAGYTLYISYEQQTYMWCAQYVTKNIYIWWWTDQASKRASVTKHIREIQFAFEILSSQCKRAHQYLNQAKTLFHLSPFRALFLFFSLWKKRYCSQLAVSKYLLREKLAVYFMDDTAKYRRTHNCSQH